MRKWSRHSRRIDPMTRSTKGFCQGACGAMQDLANPHPLDSPRELIAVDRVSITEQELRSRVVRERLDDLLSCPGCRGMVRDVDVDELAAVVAKDDEAKSRRKVRVGTTKKSMATMSRACAARKARHVGDGRGDVRCMYLATVSSATP